MHELRKKILPIALPSMIEAEKFSDHPRKVERTESESNSDPFSPSLFLYTNWATSAAI